MTFCVTMLSNLCLEKIAFARYYFSLTDCLVVHIKVISAHVLFAESLEGSKDQGIGYRPRGCFASPCALATKRQLQETALVVSTNSR